MRRDDQEYIDYMGGWNDAISILYLIEKGLTLPQIKKKFADSDKWDRQPMYVHLKKYIQMIQKRRKHDAKTADDKQLS